MVARQEGSVGFTGHSSGSVASTDGDINGDQPLRVFKGLLPQPLLPQDDRDMLAEQQAAHFATVSLEPTQPLRPAANHTRVQYSLVVAGG
jgi:hypothetical protein